jgi:hypothetical protein
LAADDLILPTDNHGNHQMELDFDLNAQPFKANQEHLNNEALDQDVQLSFKWVSSGDAGTKFFHANVTFRHRQNFVTSLEDSNGSFLS